jgi:hypothetical protein
MQPSDTDTDEIVEHCGTWAKEAHAGFFPSHRYDRTWGFMSWGRLPSLSLHDTHNGLGEELYICRTIG